MAIICPNFSNPDVAREFEELKNATSEAAAYHIWSLNNGNSIDKAPNGADSILFSTLLGYFNGDRTKAILAKAKVYGNGFLTWFGDWLNDPTNASKIVDENGEPLVVYHTSKNKFSIFDKEKINTGLGLLEGDAYGFYFTTDPEVVKTKTYNVIYPVFLNARSIYDDNDYASDEFTKHSLKIIATATSNSRKKADALLNRDRMIVESNTYDELVVFEPNQIKSATDNSGIFSRLNNDIRAMLSNSGAYDNFNPYAFRRRGAIVLNDLVSSNFNSYLQKSRGRLPKQFYDAARDLTYIKSSNRKTSRRYNVVDPHTGEILMRGLPIYTKDEYEELKKKNNEINKLIDSNWKPSDKRSFAFRKFLQTPSKGLFKFAAKLYLRESASEEIGENINYAEIIDRFVDNFSDDFWRHIITSTLGLSFGGQLNGLEGVLGATTPDEGWVFDNFIFPETISKKSLIYKLELELGVKIRGEHNFDVEFNEHTPYNKLVKGMRQWYNYWKNNTTESESIELYAKDHGLTVEEVKETLKALSKMETMSSSEYALAIRTYSKFDSAYRKIVLEYNDGFIKYLKEQLGGSISENDLRTIYIIFNRDSTSILMERLAAVLHEPFHALAHLHNTDELEKSFSSFLKTNIGSNIYKAVTNGLLRQGYNNSSIEEEFLANLFSYYMTPEELRVSYYGVTAPIQILAKELKKLERIPEFETVTSIDNVVEFEKRIEHYTEEERVVLTFFQRARNAISRFLKKLYKGFSNLIKEIPETVTVEKTKEVEVPVIKQIEREYKVYNADAVNARNALEDIFSRMESLMKAPTNKEDELELNGNDVRAMVVGEKGAKSLDAAEKVTTELELSDVIQSDNIEQLRIQYADMMELYVNNELQQLLFDKDSDYHADIEQARDNATQQWASRVSSEIMQNTQLTLTEAFGLQRQEDGSWISTNDQDDLLVLFVNTLGDGYGGSYTMAQESDLAHNTIMIGMDLADATTFNHELAHYYVRKFWNSKVILDALKAVDKRGMTDLEREEALVDKLTELSIDNLYNNNELSWFTKTWNSISMMLHNTFNITNKTAKKTLVNNAAKAFIVNEQLQHHDNIHAIYKMYHGTVYLTKALKVLNKRKLVARSAQHLEPLGTDKDEVAVSNIVNAVLSKQKAADIKGGYTQQQYATLFNFTRRIKERMRRLQKHRIEMLNPTLLLVSVDGLLYEKINIIKEFVLNVGSNITTTIDALNDNKTSNYTFLSFNDLYNYKTDVIGYYVSLLNDTYLFLLDGTVTQKYDQQEIYNLSLIVYDLLNQCRSIDNEFKRQLKIVITRKLTHILEDSMDTLDPEWVERAKISLRAWIENDNIFGDISSFRDYIVGIASHSKSMVIRELHDILEDIDDKIYDESNKIGALLRDLLYKARKEWRLHGHIGDFQKLFMEIDQDTGLPTGNFCRDLNWGTWQRRKDEYTSYILYNYSSRSSKKGIEQRIQEYLNDPQFELLIDEYGFPDFPDGCELFEKEYLEKMNEWHSKNTERLFTPEYYKMRLSILSVKTLKALRVVQNNINEILNICRDKDGNIDLSILTPNQLAMLKHYLYDKDLLSNFYYLDGSPKTGDDLLIAEDLYNWNRFLKDAGIKYTPNITLYKTLRANSGNSLLFDNMWSTRIINPQLYDLLPPGKYKTEEYEKLKYMYNKLMSLIKPKGYYEPRVQDIWDDVNKQIKPEWYLFFKSLADLSDEIEKESLNNSKGPAPYKPFVPYNEMFTEKEVRHPTANMSWYTYIYKELEAKYMATNDPLWNNKFRAELNIIRKATAPFDALPMFFTTTFANSTNTGTPQSYDYYLYIDDLDVNGDPTIITVNPIDNITKERTGLELYFATVRLVSGLFNELRPLLSNPTYINVDYDESRGAGRLSYPRPDVYDNSKSFNKIKGESKVLYDMLINTMKTKYEELGIFKNDYDYRLPQRGGNAYQLAHRRKNFLSTMWWGIKREFLYVETDDFFNDNWAQRPDGSIVQNPKILFIKRLDDPWAINSDVTGSVIKFAEMATEYRIKSENQGLIENILDVSKLTGPDTTQTAKLEHMVNTEFYGRKLTFNLRGQLKGSGKGKGSRAALKALRRIRIIAQTHMLAFNLFSGIVSSLDPFFKLLVDALTGKYTNAWDFIKAIGTIISQMPQAIRSLGRSRTTSKVQALLQKLGINRNIENTYHDLDRNLAYRFLTSGLGMMVFGLGDYTTTALTAVAMMKNFRFYKHSDPNKSGFYLHEEFVRVAMSDGKEKKDAEKLYRDAINYYAMYSYSDPKEGLKAELNWSRGRRNSMKLKFSDAAPYLTEKLNSRIRKAIRSRVSIYNAIVLDNEKTQLQTNIWWSFISMLRNFLLVGINERFKDQRDFLVNPNSLNGLAIDPKTGNPINYTTKQIKRGLRMYTGGWNFQTRQIEPGVFTGAGRTIYQFFRKVKWFSSFIVRSTPSAIADMFMWWKKGRTSNWSKFKDTRKTLKENSLDISKADMWAFKKVCLELALIAVLFLLYSFIIHPWADEHKDEYLALAIDYVTGRLLTETSTWVNPLTASDVVSSITPWTGDVKKKLMIVELCAQIYQIANNGLDEQMVKRGAYTGLPRWLRAAGNVYGPLGNFITSFRTDAIKSKSNYYEKIGFYYPLYKWIFSPTESVSAKMSSKKGKKQKLSGKINPNKSGKVNRNIK